jgi:hypothetical protein
MTMASMITLQDTVGLLPVWGFIRDRVYVPPLPADLPELKNRIEADIATFTREALTKVLEELTYRLDVCRVTNCDHIKHL